MGVCICEPASCSEIDKETVQFSYTLVQYTARCTCFMCPEALLVATCRRFGDRGKNVLLYHGKIDISNMQNSTHLVTDPTYAASCIVAACRTQPRHNIMCGSLPVVGLVREQGRINRGLASMTGRLLGLPALNSDGLWLSSAALSLDESIASAAALSESSENAWS